MSSAEDKEVDLLKYVRTGTHTENHVRNWLTAYPLKLMVMNTAFWQVKD
jgi:hypothetical protein